MGKIWCIIVTNKPLEVRAVNKLGVLIAVNRNTDFSEKLGKVKEYGFECCQLSCWDMGMYTDAGCRRRRWWCSTTRSSSGCSHWQMK